MIINNELYGLVLLFHICINIPIYFNLSSTLIIFPSMTWKEYILYGCVALVIVMGVSWASTRSVVTKSKYPIYAEDSLMNKKQHGTCVSSVQQVHFVIH